MGMKGVLLMGNKAKGILHMDTKENILMGTIGFIFMVSVRVLLSGIQIYIMFETCIRASLTTLILKG